MTTLEQCAATDTSGARCTLTAGHPGAHQLTPAIKPQQGDSLARIIATVLIVLVAAVLIGAILPIANGTLFAIAGGAIISVIYIASASRKR